MSVVEGDQMSLFAAARAQRDDGMARAEAHAPLGWPEQAFRVLRAFALEHEWMHVDAYWAWAESHGLPEPPNGRALGPVIKRAAKAGVIERTPISAPSVRSNLSHKPVWRSLVYRGQRTGRFGDVQVPA